MSSNTVQIYDQLELSVATLMDSINAMGLSNRNDTRKCLRRSMFPENETFKLKLRKGVMVATLNEVEDYPDAKVLSYRDSQTSVELYAANESSMFPVKEILRIRTCVFCGVFIAGSTCALALLSFSEGCSEFIKKRNEGQLRMKCRECSVDYLRRKRSQKKFSQVLFESYDMSIDEVLNLEYNVPVNFILVPGQVRENINKVVEFNKKSVAVSATVQGQAPKPAHDWDSPESVEGQTRAETRAEINDIQTAIAKIDTFIKESNQGLIAELAQLKVSALNEFRKTSEDLEMLTSLVESLSSKIRTDINKIGHDILVNHVTVPGHVPTITRVVGEGFAIEMVNSDIDTHNYRAAMRNSLFDNYESSRALVESMFSSPDLGAIIASANATAFNFERFGTCLMRFFGKE